MFSWPSLFSEKEGFLLCHNYLLFVVVIIAMVVCVFATVEQVIRCLAFNPVKLGLSPGKGVSKELEHDESNNVELAVLPIRVAKVSSRTSHLAGVQEEAHIVSF